MYNECIFFHSSYKQIVEFNSWLGTSKRREIFTNGGWL